MTGRILSHRYRFHGDSSVVNWRRAGVWLVDLRCHGRRERLAETVVTGFKLIAQVFANALARRRMEEQLQERLREIDILKQRLERENLYLKEEVKLLLEHKDIVGQSLAIRKVLHKVEQVAGTDSTVLLLGETGTGKELLAMAIHRMSSRKDRPLITINCASLPPTLIESELFGRKKAPTRAP